MKISMDWKAALAVSILILAAGCSTGSAAPFHMYSSPLLEGEMDTPRSGSDGDGNMLSPGVEPRQVYVYQRWHPEGTPAPQQRHIRGGGMRRGPAYGSKREAGPGAAPFGSSEPTGAGRRQSSASMDHGNNNTGETTQVAPPANHVGSAPWAAQFVHTTLAINEIEFSDSAAESIPVLYRQCRSEGEVFQSSEPNIGDLVFFHNTYDANDDGRNNDWYTLVGIIERVAPNGTVEFLAYRGDGVEKLYLNLDQLERPTTARGHTLNSKLRNRTSDDAPFTQYLAGQLFAGYCNILGDRQELILMDEWSPDMDI